MSISMEASEDRPRRRGRRAKRGTRRDVTMRFIARKDLWNPIALQCGITPEEVRSWRRVPAEHVSNVERAIGREARLIRPDLFPRN